MLRCGAERECECVYTLSADCRHMYLYIHANITHSFNCVAAKGISFLLGQLIGYHILTVVLKCVPTVVLKCVLTVVLKCVPTVVLKVSLASLMQTGYDVCECGMRGGG
jgi:hypothetical protein